MSLAENPLPPAGRAAVLRVVFEAADVDPVRALLIEECTRRGLEVDEIGPDLFLETYLDTRDLRVHRAGTFLVHRDFGAASEVGWRALRDADEPDGLPSFGTSVALPSASPRIPEECPEPMRGALRALAGRHPLRPVLRMDVRREELVVKRSGRWLGTVVLTRAVSTRESPIAAVRLARVEIRAAVDAIGTPDPLFETLREGSGLHATAAPQYEAALLAAALPARTHPATAPDRLHLGITSGELAFAVLRRQFAVIVRHEPGARLGLDPEELHRLRVGVRRLRAALRLWRDGLGPSARELQREWGLLGRALGETRDWDVELSNLDAWGAGLGPGERDALGFVQDFALARREEARLRMLLTLDSRRQERLTRVTSRWIREARPGTARRRPPRAGEAPRAATTDPQARRGLARSGAPPGTHPGEEAALLPGVPRGDPGPRRAAHGAAARPHPGPAGGDPGSARFAGPAGGRRTRCAGSAPAAGGRRARAPSRGADAARIGAAHGGPGGARAFVRRPLATAEGGAGSRNVRGVEACAWC